MKTHKKNMPQKNDLTIYMILAGFILLIGAIIFMATRPTGNAIYEGEGEYDEFAQCLTDNGATFYGTEWCGFCNQQKEMLGASMQYINFVDCDKNNAVCQNEGITGFPTWKINGIPYSGLQQLPRLAELTGCELNL